MHYFKDNEEFIKNKKNYGIDAHKNKCNHFSEAAKYNEYDPTANIRLYFQNVNSTLIRP